MLYDSPRTRALSRPGLQIAVVALALAILPCWTRPGRASQASACIPRKAAVTARASADTVQLADEITRRLRRMGINFSRTRLPHPYDPVGEVC